MTWPAIALYRGMPMASQPFACSSSTVATASSASSDKYSSASRKKVHSVSGSPQNPLKQRQAGDLARRMAAVADLAAADTCQDV